MNIAGTEKIQMDEAYLLAKLVIMIIDLFHLFRVTKLYSLQISPSDRIYHAKVWRKSKYSIG